MLFLAAFLLALIMFFMMCSSILIGLIGAAFLQTPFEAAIIAAWERPLLLLLFTLVLIPVLAATGSGLAGDTRRFQ